MKHVLMPFAKKMKVMEKCLLRSDSKQHYAEKKMLIFDIGFFCILVQTFEGWALFDVENGSGAPTADENQVLYFPSIRIHNQKREKPIEPKDQINNCNMILQGQPPQQPTLRY